MTAFPTVAAGVVTALVVLLFVPGLLAVIGLDRGSVLAAYVGLSPALLQAGWPALALGLVLGRWWLTAPAAVLCAAAVAAWWVASHPGPVEPDAPGPRLRIVTANLFYRNDHAAECWPVIAAYEPDVVVLQEVSWRSASWLPPAGWHVVSDVRQDAFGTALLTREPVRGWDIVALAGLPQLRATIRHAGRAVTVWSLHPLAPTRREPDQVWRRQLRELNDRVLADAADVLILGGDFNATPLHRPLRQLLRRAGLVDARPGTRRLHATWPSGGEDSPPGLRRVMALDHVLVRGATVCSAQVLSATSSDHFPVGVELALPALD